jgi:hypothetical protein
VLEFRTPDELRTYPELKGRVTKFSFHFHQDRRILTVFPGSFFNPLPYVYAQGETEAWSAGAVEVVYSFLSSHRLWYHWFVSLAMGWLFIVLTLVSVVAWVLSLKSPAFPRGIVLAWFSTLTVFSFLHSGRAILLPSSILRITNEEGFLRRHVAELSLILALLSAVLTVVGWFFRK